MLFEPQIAREPDLYPWTQKFIESIQDTPWTVRNFNFASDVHDFKVTLNDDERQIIVRALATIAQIEYRVKRFWTKLGDTLDHPSVVDLGITFGANEVVHSAAYGQLLKVLGIKTITDEILQLDIIRGRENYLTKHLHKFHADNRRQFIYSIILFSLFVENIALFSQFYTISWFQRSKNVLKNTNTQIEYTSREENLHALAGIRIVQALKEEYPELFDQELEDKVIYEAGQAVKYEFQIIEWIINGYSGQSSEGEVLSSPALKEFIKARMNQSLADIGYKKIFDVDKDILEDTKWFDIQLIGNNQKDFFHDRPVEYAKNGQSFAEEDLF